MRDFIEAVDDVYQSAESHREMLERSLVLSTEELHQSNAEMRAIFQAIPDLLFRLGHDGTILDLKAGTYADLLLAPRDLIGKKIQKIPNKQVALAFQNSLDALSSSGSTCPIEYGLNVKGRECYYEARLVPLLADQVVVIIQNITIRKQGQALIQEHTVELQRINSQLQAEIERRHAVEEVLRHDVFHDQLTGLPNRGMLLDRIEHCFRQARRDPNYHFAALFIDVDDFKTVNDRMGHEAGDYLLKSIGERLTKSIRAVDTASRFGVASRLGGDEFVLILGGITSKSDAILVAERIEELMSEPFLIERQEVVASLSIGIALNRPEYDDAADILRDADAAVYRAKHEGKHRIVIFDPEMRSEAPLKPIDEDAWNSCPD
ncbi:MAG: diguanylate cyclase [Terracidiphilus sp.]